MDDFIEKMMELGACDDRACSETGRKNIKNEAIELYKKHIKTIKNER